MSFKPGSVVGDYTVLGSVGAGGMGTVYKVQHVITKRIEAMKLLASGKTDPDQEQRFVREMQVQARLHHPNIAEVYNAFRFYDEFFMVMEFIEGESLEQVLAKQRPPLETGIGYARQALGALAYAHGNGVVHRDIAPANMIITPEGTVKLTDFGLAKTATDVRLTQSGAPVGSPWYMSPEQVRGGAELDARSDIYSLGAVLYEIVTGHKVFNRETAFDVMRAQVELPPVAPIEREPHLPVGLNEIILIALAKDPAARFQSAEQFREALEPFERTAPPASVRAAARRAPARPWPVVRIAQTAVGTAAVSVALVAGYSTYSLLRAGSRVELPNLVPPKAFIPPAPDYVPPRETVAESSSKPQPPLERRVKPRPFATAGLPLSNPRQANVDARPDTLQLHGADGSKGVDLAPPRAATGGSTRALLSPALPPKPPEAPVQASLPPQSVVPATPEPPPAPPSAPERKEHRRFWRALTHVFHRGGSSPGPSAATEPESQQ